MAKITLSNVLSGFNLSKINANFTAIAEVLNNKILWRNNPAGEPNQLESDLDVNGKSIYNLPAPAFDNQAARLKDVRDALQGQTGIVPFPASLIPASDGSGGSLFTTVQGAITYLMSSFVSSIISYGQAGAGAVVRTVQDRLREKFSSRDWGIGPTNTATVNSNRLNTMIAAMSAGQVLVLQDAIDLDSSVSIVVNKAITIRGDRNNRIRFTHTTGGGQRPIRSTVNGVVFEKLWFDGSLIANTNNPLDTVYYVSSDNSDTTIRHCRFTNFPVYRVPVVFLKEDTSINTLDWQSVDECHFFNTGGGVLTVTSNTKVSNCIFLESTDTAIAFNGMGARHCSGCTAVGNIIVTNTKVGPYLIAIEGSTENVIVGNYVHSVYGQALSAIDVDPGTQTAEKLGTITGNTFRCETSSDTDPRTLVQIGGFYFDGVISGNTFRGIPGIGTNASQLLISMGNHIVSGNIMDTGYTSTANGYALIDYQPALVAGSLSVRNNTMTITRAARVLGSTFTGNFSTGSNLLFSYNTLINTAAFCSIIVDAPANGVGTDPTLMEYINPAPIGTAVPTMISGLAYNSQNTTYGRDFLTFSGTGSAGRVIRSPASFTGINLLSDSVTASGTGWRHLSCTSSTGGAENLGILGNGNVQNANNSYGALSDIKLKQDIQDAGSQWNDIKSLRLRKYRFKSDPTGLLQLGLIAQEAEVVSPGLIEQISDIEIIDGEAIPTGEVTKTIKYSVLYLKAIGAIQELINRVEQLESEIKELKNG